MNRRANFLEKLWNILKECGVDYIITSPDNKNIEAFVIDYDDGTNHGDNIEITTMEIMEYCKSKKNDDATVD